MNPLGTLIPRQEQDNHPLSSFSFSSPSSFIFLVFSALAIAALTIYYVRNQFKERKVTLLPPQRPPLAIAPVLSAPAASALSAAAASAATLPSTTSVSPSSQAISPVSEASLSPHVATWVSSIAASFPSSSDPTSPYGIFERFYLNIGKDAEGRTLAQLQGLSLDDMELNHSYIQWMCPIDQPSQFNFQAPVLTVQQYRTLSQNPIIKENVKRSFLKLLAFFGLQYRSKRGIIHESATFQTRSKIWLTHYNHNYLRMTRILRWLVLFDFNREAQALYRFLETLRSRREIPEATFNFWQKAAQPIAEYKSN